MSFSTRPFSLLAVLALAAVAACGDDPGAEGDAASGSGGGGAAGSGTTTSGSVTTGGDATTSATGGDATGGGTTTTATGGDATTSATGGSDVGATSSTTTTSGAGGAPPATGSGGGTPSGGCAAASIFCSDFEVDSLPSELVFFPEYLRNSIGDYVTLDNTGHSGTRSIKVSGTGFSQMLAVPVPSTFWGRVYLKSDTDIQSGHNTYVAAVSGTGDPNDGEHVRIGEHQCQLELNRKSDDAEKLSNGGKYECSGGVKFVANTWYCLEFYYDGPGREVRVFVDDTEVDALHVTDWGPYDYKFFKFGFEKYHGGNKTMWYDDLALGTQRIGCGL